MKSLIILALAVIACSADKSFDKCKAGGAKYWCASVKNARECHTTDFCIAKVWKTMESKVMVADPLCDLCRNLTSTVQKFLENANNEKFLADALDQVCAAIPDASIAQMCKQYIDQDLPQVLQMLANEMDPSQVCSLLQLCNAAASPKAEPIKSKGVGANVECVICEWVMSKLEDTLKKNSTEAEIEAALDKVCSILPSSVQAQCIDFVNQYTDIIVKLILQAESPAAICSALGLCSATEAGIRPNSVEAMQVRNLQDVECEACQLIINYVDKILKDQTTMQEVLKTVEKVCDIIPSAEKDACVNAISEYGPIILGMLAENLDPDTICKEVKLCPTMKNRLADILLKPVINQ